MSLAVVLLAAGASSRLGECKALVALEGAPPIARLIAATHAAGPSVVVVVGGAHADALEAWLASQHWRPGAAVRGAAADAHPRLVRHAGWAAGRLGSLAAATRELPGHDLLVAPVDVPLVSAGTVAALAAAFREAGEPPRGWFAPAYGGRHGHPLVLGRELAARCLELPPDTPLSALRASASPLGSVPVGDEAILDDLDTPADLARLRERLRAGRGPADPG